MSKIVRNGAPTSTTPGILGQEYYDKETGKSYICTSVNYDPDDEIGEIDGTYVWEESSGASWNDLADKPFYEEETPTENVLCECVVTHEYEEEGLYFNDHVPLNFNTIEIATACVIIFDNISYTLTVNASPEGMPFVGSEGLFYNGVCGEGEPPFVIMSSWEDTRKSTIIMADGGEHTIKATAYIYNVHKIDEKYLPTTSNIFVDGENSPLKSVYVRSGNGPYGPASIVYDTNSQELRIGGTPAFHKPYDTITLTTSNGLPAVGSTEIFEVNDKETIEHLRCGSTNNYIQEVRIMYMNDHAYTLWFDLDYCGGVGWTESETNTPYTGITVGPDGGIYTLRVYKTSDTNAKVLLKRVL